MGMTSLCRLIIVQIANFQASWHFFYDIWQKFHDLSMTGKPAAIFKVLPGALGTLLIVQYFLETFVSEEAMNFELLLLVCY